MSKKRTLKLMAELLGELTAEVVYLKEGLKDARRTLDNIEQTQADFISCCVGADGKPIVGTAEDANPSDDNEDCDSNSRPHSR